MYISVHRHTHSGETINRINKMNIKVIFVVQDSGKFEITSSYSAWIGTESFVRDSAMFEIAGVDCMIFYHNFCVLFSVKKFLHWRQTCVLQRQFSVCHRWYSSENPSDKDNCSKQHYYTGGRLTHSGETINRIHKMNIKVIFVVHCCE